MPTFEFTLHLEGPSDAIEDDAKFNSLYAVGCDDGLFVVIDGRISVDFCRQAESLGKAVGSAIDDIIRADVGLWVAGVDLAPFGDEAD